MLRSRSETMRMEREGECGYKRHWTWHPNKCERNKRRLIYARPFFPVQNFSLLTLGCKYRRKKNTDKEMQGD